MSPEQARGQPVDERSDVFSLGVLLYEMVAGEPPFEANETPALLHKIVYSPAPPLARLRGSAGGALEALIRKALQKKPKNRFAGVADGNACHVSNWSRGPQNITTRSTRTCLANRAAVVDPCEAPAMMTRSQRKDLPSAVRK